MEYKFSKDSDKISDLRIFFITDWPDIVEKPTYKWIKNGFKKNTNIFSVEFYILFFTYFIICKELRII